MAKHGSISRMDKAGRAEASIEAALIAAALFCFWDNALIIPLCTAAAVHELGHIAAMTYFGRGIKRIKAELHGLCIVYDVGSDRRANMAIALAGPLFGAAFALAAAYLGNKSNNQLLLFAAGASAILTAFNLLPALPLDGGVLLRLLAAEKTDEEYAESLSARVSRATALTVTAAGLALLIYGRGPAPLAAGIWLLLYQSEWVL